MPEPVAKKTHSHADVVSSGTRRPASRATAGPVELRGAPKWAGGAAPATAYNSRKVPQASLRADATLTRPWNFSVFCVADQVTNPNLFVKYAHTHVESHLDGFYNISPLPPPSHVHHQRNDAHRSSLKPPLCVASHRQNVHS
jgi:hypothetical protein